MDLLEVLRDHDFFIKKIEMCEKLRLEEIERKEKGLPDESFDEEKKSEWQKLKESPDEEYLRKTILPLLTPVLFP